MGHGRVLAGASPGKSRKNGRKQSLKEENSYSASSEEGLYFQESSGEEGEFGSIRYSEEEEESRSALFQKESLQEIKRRIAVPIRQRQTDDTESGGMSPGSASEKLELDSEAEGTDYSKESIFYREESRKNSFGSGMHRLETKEREPVRRTLADDSFMKSKGGSNAADENFIKFQAEPDKQVEPFLDQKPPDRFKKEDKLRGHNHGRSIEPRRFFCSSVPWKTREYSRIPTVQLHQEIMDFVEYLKPSRQETEARAYVSVG